MHKNIRNLKDPTVVWAQKLLQILGLIALSTQLCPATVATVLNKRTSWDSNGYGALRNVSCIAHDTKFTCDCQNINEHLQLPNLNGFVYQVEVSNCKSLTIEANALEETQGLRKIMFKNIENLVLNKYALAFPRFASSTPLIVEFEKVNFERIESHAINGNIEEISFIGGRINVIHPFGFTTLKERALLLKMHNVLVQKMEAQAFKKFAVDQIEITDCVFESKVPSKAFYELDVMNTLFIHNVKFNEVHSRAFSFKMVSKLIISNNYFSGVDSEWIEAYVRESVVIKENHFGTVTPIAFKAITIHRDYMLSDRLEMRFLNNTVHFAQNPRPLEFNERFALNIKQLQYENLFECKDLDYTQKPPRPTIEFFHKFCDNIYFHSKAQTNNNNSNNQSFVALSKLIEKDCQVTSYLLYIILGVTAIVLVIILIAVIVWLYIAKKRKRRKMMEVIMPEPRTYKETQIVYQIENAGLLKTDL